MEIEKTELETEKPKLIVGDDIRRDFDVEKHNNKLFIYTSKWNDEGEKVFRANTISETELRRIVQNMQKFL